MTAIAAAHVSAAACLIPVIVLAAFSMLIYERFISKVSEVETEMLSRKVL